MSNAFLVETFQRMLDERMPNLFRLHISPFVAQTCLSLAHYVKRTWPNNGRSEIDYQSFLANSFDEALSGAIKLARYDATLAGRSSTCLILDPAGRCGSFASARADQRCVPFIPGVVVRGPEPMDSVAKHLIEDQIVGTLVLIADESLEQHADLVEAIIRRDDPLIVTCVSRATLTTMFQNPGRLLDKTEPDIVVFDETFTDRAVPFGAFTARIDMYDHWNRRGKSTFHSTTFQPNTISSFHFMRCLERDDPESFAALAPRLTRLEADLDYRNELYGRLYSPSLRKAARLTRCDRAAIQASGGYVLVDGKPIFDAVSGVACSVRGHNPEGYVQDIEGIDPESVEHELGEKLRELTGLPNMLPAVSGASAVESALKLALVANSPRRHVIALKSGFGGKTLLALTGTHNASYKTHLDPLYSHVTYIDPFAADAIEQMEIALEKHPVAVVQVELIQGVGGVRRVPDELLNFLESNRERHGYFLLVDEVQTGMYRTGPFTRSSGLGLKPDLLVAGKGVSDMMFPFALVLYAEKVRARLEQMGSSLPAELRERHGFDWGFRTAFNVLRHAEILDLKRRVLDAGLQVKRQLTEGLADCRAVREVRVFGLLIGIELDTKGWSKRRFRKRLFWFYLSNMLRHRRFPVLVGFCQYEPHVLKITPPLNATDAELRQMCTTVIDVLRRPFLRLAATVAGSMALSIIPRRHN